jgi:hypothetical protein
MYHGAKKDETGGSMAATYLVFVGFAGISFVILMVALDPDNAFKDRDFDLLLITALISLFSFLFGLGVKFIEFVSKKFREKNESMKLEAERLNGPKPSLEEKTPARPGEIEIKIDPALLVGRLNVPQSMVLPIVAAVQSNYYTDPEVVITAVNRLARVLPPFDLVEMSDHGTRWLDLIGKYRREHVDDNDFLKATLMLRDSLEFIGDIRFRLTIPEKIRNEHTHILARSGGGKTYLLQSMILRDIEEENGVVVIDSQEQMIPKLLKVVPPERLVYIDPTDEYVPAISLFGSTSVDLLEYVFSALETELTTKQATVYRFVSRLCAEIPNANIKTMLKILETGVGEYQPYVKNLNDIGQSFFDNQFGNHKQYGETKAQIIQRLYTLLEMDTFDRMFSVTENKINIGRLLDEGKVILVNTAASVLKGAVSIYGRFWIAQVAEAVFQRKEGARRTYVYIDEIYDYLSEGDDALLSKLFTQARKREVGLIVAHQELNQLPTNIQSNIMTNTVIKLVRDLSYSDTKAMANEMRTTPAEIDGLPKYTFLLGLKNQGCYPYKAGRDFEMAVKDARVDSERLLAEQRSKYRVRPKKATAKPPALQGGIVPEQGEWQSE